MDRTERFYKIQRLLTERRVVPRQMMLERLAVSPATFKRDLEYLRDRMGMPVIWDRALNGYRLDRDSPDAALFELPGLWFSAEEVHALVTMEQLLEGLQPGALSGMLKPVRSRIQRILGAGEFDMQQVSRRIRVLQMGVRPVQPGHFQAISSALLSRRRLDIDYYNRGNDTTVRRQISPQRLVYYRDNWYLDSWCHLRKDLRTFSVDAIVTAVPAKETAKEVDEATLDAVLGAGFGIFSGCETQTAVLRFTAERARWVARETWHPSQTGQFRADGCWELQFPYSDPRELIMDILKYGADVEVLAPDSLRTAIAANLRLASAQYSAAVVL